MNTLVQLSLSATGSPSDVKARFADQASAAASANPDNAAIIGALRSTVEKQLASISEDATLAVGVELRIAVGDPPATVTAKQEAAKAEVAALKASIATANDQIAQLRTDLSGAQAKITEMSEPRTSGEVTGSTNSSGS